MPAAASMSADTITPSSFSPIISAIRLPEIVVVSALALAVNSGTVWL